MKILKERMTLTSSDAEQVFGCSTAIDGDYSLQALVRAIVLKYGQCPLDQLGQKTRIERIRMRDADDMQYVLSDGNATIYIVECINCVDEPVSVDGWASEYTINGKQFLPSRYLSQFCKTKIFINQDAQRIVAFVERRATHVWVQAFESIIARLMPWYFPSDLSDEEKKLFTTISEAGRKISEEDAATAFIGFVNSAAKDIDFRQIRLHKYLDGIADRIIRVRIGALQNDRDSYLRNIKSYSDSLRQYYDAYERVMAEITALELAPPNSDTSMFEFFNSHKQLTVIDADDYIQFGVADTLEFYDEDAFERLSRNAQSYFAEYEPDVQKALCAIFKEHRGVIRVQAVFDLAGMKLVTPRRGMTFKDGYMPNPHIYYFACSGGNDVYYHQYADEGNWDLGIEQAIAATKNINWGDSTVCRKMIDWLHDSSEQCIYVRDDFEPIDTVDPSMKVVSFRDFMDRICGQE